MSTNRVRTQAAERRPRIEAARRELLAAMADIEVRHQLSAVESLEVLTAYQQFLVGFCLAHPARAFAAAKTAARQRAAAPARP